MSTLMFDGRSPNAVLELAAEAVHSLGRFDAEATYVMTAEGALTKRRRPSSSIRNQLDRSVTDSIGTDRALFLPDKVWRYVVTLRSAKGVTGMLVVRAPATPSADDMSLLKVLSQHTAAAMTSAALLDRERDQQLELRELIAERATTIARLSKTVAELERHEQIHQALMTISSSGAGEAGIAETLHRMISFPVAVEDAFGNLRAWAGDKPKRAYQRIGGANRADVLREAAAVGVPRRDGDRLFCVIRPRGDILAVLFLVDPDRLVDDLDTFALVYGATVLGLELSHRRELAEAELRLRRDLVEDLLSGTDNISAYSRADALGHDLHLPHCVAVLEWKDKVDNDVVAAVVARWAIEQGHHPLTARRPTVAVIVTDGPPDASSMHLAVSTALGSPRGSIGVGSLVDSPSDLPRSLSEAQRALEIQKKSGAPYGSRRFEDLGVYRILDPGGSRPEVQGFVREWLGKLLAYDRDKQTELVRTLAHYLDCGGNYDQTAHSLNIHRSTLRYRLGRVREISGHDLQNANTRLNVHLATRVLDVLGCSDLATESTDHE